MQNYRQTEPTGRQPANKSSISCKIYNDYLAYSGEEKDNSDY